MFYCNIYLSSLDTLLIDNDVEVGNTEQRQLTTFTDIFVVSKTVTSKDMLLNRSYITKKSKAEKGLKEVDELKVDDCLLAETMSSRCSNRKSHLASTD